MVTSRAVVGSSSAIARLGLHISAIAIIRPLAHTAREKTGRVLVQPLAGVRDGRREPASPCARSYPLRLMAALVNLADFRQTVAMCVPPGDSDVIGSMTDHG